MGKAKNTYIQDAKNIFELWSQLKDVIGTDDNKKPEDYPVQEVIEEAKDILYKYLEGGSSLNEDYTGEWGKEAQQEAREEVRKLRNFIKKWNK